MASYLDYIIQQQNDYINNKQGKVITFVSNLNTPLKKIEHINLLHDPAQDN